jgi:hypothetical protein
VKAPARQNDIQIPSGEQEQMLQELRAELYGSLLSRSLAGQVLLRSSEGMGTQAQ